MLVLLWLGLQGCWVKGSFGVSRGAPVPQYKYVLCVLCVLCVVVSFSVVEGPAALAKGVLCWVCAGIPGERELGLVVHFPK
jgi:hypothetical protein